MWIFIAKDENKDRRENGYFTKPADDSRGFYTNKELKIVMINGYTRE